MKVAAIDMGTNSSRLLIVDWSDGEYKVIERSLITTRLGKGVDKNKILQQDAISRGLSAVAEFKNKIDNERVQKVAIVGTSALRDVSNAAELSKLIETKTGYRMKVVSGIEEAELIYRGVNLDYKGDKLLIIDIGGGSTEFIWNNSGINFNSLNIGAVRMTERYITDPEYVLKNREYRQIYRQVQEQIETIDIKYISQLKTVGVGGTITTLGAIDQELDIYDSKKIHGYKLTIAAVKRNLSILKNKNMAQRKMISGLQPTRADIITAGTIILEAIMDDFNIEEIKISENDILYGIIRQICK